MPSGSGHKLRRHQTPGAVQDRGPSSATRSGAVSLPAQGHRDEDSSQRLHGAHAGERAVSERSTVLLEHHLKELKLPTFLREYGKVAGQCAAEGVDHPGYLLRLSELELIERHHRMVDRRIKAARFPAVKSLDTFNFLAMPSVNKHLVMQLVRREYADRRENVIAVGNSGTGKTPRGPRPGARRLPEGAVGRLHHRRLAGPRADRGHRRATTAQPPEEAGPTQAAHHRRAWLRPTLQDRRGAPLRGLQSEVREGVGPRHHQPALRRVD